MSELHVLQLETINKCNGSCVFCAYPLQEKKRKNMPMPLFKKIINEAKELKPLDIYPFLMNEPFLDEELPDKIAYINEAHPKSRVCVYTNASFLNNKMKKNLQKVKIHYLNISLNAINNEDRQKLMGLDLIPALENTMFLKKIYPEAMIVASCLLDPIYISNDKMVKFVTLCDNLQIHKYFFIPGNWAGKLRPLIIKGESCKRIANHLTILSDGTANMCCQDPEGIVNYGNLKDFSIKEIWECEKRKQYQELNCQNRRYEIKICSQCTSI